MRWTVVVVAGVLALVLATSGCVSGVPQEPGSEPRPSATKPTTSRSTPPATPAGPLKPSGTPSVLAAGLSVPWSVVRLSDGSALISERDTARILEYTESGGVRVAATLEHVVPGGEGGLLGLAVLETPATRYLYAYYTSASDNRIVRMPLLGSSGHYRLGEEEIILTGVAKAANHSGGRIAFGPDGKLYATVGDAGQPRRAQSMASLNGKILRMNPDGTMPADNPFADSLIYSLGHRNPQGIAWDSSGQLWSSELGQDTWDEFNRIDPGKNYGWPIAEGPAHEEGYVDPLLQWAPSEASPSGLAFVRGTFFLATLRGQRLWAIYTHGTPGSTAWFSGEYGRLRDAAPGPEGTLWVLTNNTDGRGSPHPADDRLLQVALRPGR